MIWRFVPLAILLVAYLFIGGLFAIHTPDWQSPDEPAHYNYVRQLANGQIPIIESGDYDQAYQERVISSRFDPVYSVDGEDGFEYEDHQPPLYYLLQAPVYTLSSGRLLPMRILSVLIGGGLLVIVYFTALRIFENQVGMASAATAFVAFLPQHTSMLAAVNNDSLAELFIALIILLIIRLAASGPAEIEDFRDNSSSTRRPGPYVTLGIILGLGLLTKATVYITIPVIAGALIWIGKRDGVGVRRALFWVFGPAFLLGSVWWVRNILVYGGTDILGLAAHNEVVVGQPRTAEWIAERGLDGTLAAFARTTFQSFWGQFGWMGVVMPAWVYLSLLIFSFLTIGGLAWSRLDHRRNLGQAEGEAGGTSGAGSRIIWALMAGLFALSVVAYLGYNITFIQHQGRYLYPALLPIGLAVAMAWARLIRPLSDRWSIARFLLPAGLAVALIGLDLLALFRFIVPALEI